MSNYEELENMVYDIITEKYSFLCATLAWTKVDPNIWYLEFPEENLTFKGKSKIDCLGQLYYKFIFEPIEEEIEKTA